MEAKHAIDIVGNVYGKWTVIEQLKDRKRGSIMVIAQCNCGKRREMYKLNFIYGRNSYQCSICSIKEQKRNRICWLKPYNDLKIK